MSAPATAPAWSVARGGSMNPWAQPRFLWVFAIAYLVWTLLPVFIAVLFSFNAGEGADHVAGILAARWYVSDVNSVWQDETLRSALFQSLKLSSLTVLIAVPFGVAFAIGLDRWRAAAPRRRTS